LVDQDLEKAMHYLKLALPSGSTVAAAQLGYLMATLKREKLNSTEAAEAKVRVFDDIDEY
jgi:hypothetical protein